MKENKYARTSVELAQKQSLPLGAKVAMSQRRIIDWCEAFDYATYVSISGGKDSDTLSELVEMACPRAGIPRVFIDTGLEYASVRKHALEKADVVLRPELSFLQILTKYGYPVISKEVAQAVSEVQRAKVNGKELPSYRMTAFRGERLGKDGKKSAFNMEKYAFLLDAPFRISAKCCDYSKKKPALKYERESGRVPFIGTMATESRLRREKWLKFGCNAFDKERQTSQPLSFWTEQDVLRYILENGLTIADAYGHIVKDYSKVAFLAGQLCLSDDGLKPREDVPLKTTLCSRTGCAFCMFGITQDTKRFIRLKELEPQKYDYIMRGGKFDEQGMWVPHNGLGYKFVIDWLNEHGGLGIEY